VARIASLELVGCHNEALALGAQAHGLAVMGV
jgi:hypothetical protein